MDSILLRMDAVSRITPGETLCVVDLTTTVRGSWTSMLKRAYYQEDRNKTSIFIRQLADDIKSLDKTVENYKDLILKIPDLMVGIRSLARSYQSDAPEIYRGLLEIIEELDELVVKNIEEEVGINREDEQIIAVRPKEIEPEPPEKKSWRKIVAYFLYSCCACLSKEKVV